MTKFKVWDAATVIGVVLATDAEEAVNKAKAGNFFVNRGITVWNNDHLTVSRF